MSLVIAAASLRMRMADRETNSVPHLFDRQVTRILVCRSDGGFRYGNVSASACRHHNDSVRMFQFERSQWRERAVHHEQTQRNAPSYGFGSSTTPVTTASKPAIPITVSNGDTNLSPSVSVIPDMRVMIQKPLSFIHEIGLEPQPIASAM